MHTVVTLTRKSKVPNLYSGMYMYIGLIWLLSISILSIQCSLFEPANQSKDKAQDQAPELDESSPDEFAALSMEQKINRLKDSIHLKALGKAREQLMITLKSQPEHYELMLVMAEWASNSYKLDLANELLELLLEASSDEGASNTQEPIYYLLAENYKIQGEFQKSESYYEQLKSMYLKQSLQIKLAKLYLKIADLYAYKNDFKRSIEVLNSALDTFVAAGDLKHEIECYFTIIKNRVAQSHFEQADEALQLVTGRVKEVGDPYYSAWLKQLQGLYLIKSGLPKDALEPLEEALHYFEDAESWDAFIETKTYLGLYYREMDQYDQALQVYNDALTRARYIRAEPKRASLLNSIGLMYFQNPIIGDSFTKALDYFQKSLRIREKLSDKANQSILYHNLAATYDRMGRYDLALDAMKRSIQLHKSLGFKVLENDLIYLERLQQKYQDSTGFQRRDLDPILTLDPASDSKDVYEDVEDSVSLQQQEALQQQAEEKAELDASLSNESDVVTDVPLAITDSADTFSDETEDTATETNSQNENLTSTDSDGEDDVSNTFEEDAGIPSLSDMQSNSDNTPSPEAIDDDFASHDFAEWDPGMADIEAAESTGEGNSSDSRANNAGSAERKSRPGNTQSSRSDQSSQNLSQERAPSSR